MSAQTLSVDKPSTSPLAYSPVSDTLHPGIRPFPEFGTWADDVSIAYSGATFRLVNWLAQNRHASKNRETLWQLCKRANPDCFQCLKVVNLCRESWFLPRGEVVFQVIKDPTTIPDKPPRGVLIRHMEAIEVFGQQAEFYFLRPTFEADSMKLFTGHSAREHAIEDKCELLFMSRLYGPMLRGAARAVRAAEATYQAGLATVRGVAAGLTQLERLLATQVEKRRIRKEANGIASGMHPDRLRALMIRALELELYREAETFRQALGTWGRSQLGSSMALGLKQLGLGGLAARSKSESSFVATARRQNKQASADELRVIYQQVQELRNWDPITCFEVRSRPGKLWLEAHWYEGQDGKTYVHY